MIWVAIVLVSLTVVVFVLVRSSKFGGRKISSGLGLGASTTVSADELERMAADAEREGDWAASVRLLFRAGLRRLADQHAVQSPDQRPNGEVARQLGDPAFGALVTRFDQVAYARAPASPHDVEVARRSWPGIVRSAVEQANREREGRLESGHGRSETHKSAKKRRWRRRPLKSGDGSR